MAKKRVAAIGRIVKKVVNLSLSTVQTERGWSCTLYASSPMVCPLCQVTVPAFTEHACRKDQP